MSLGKLIVYLKEKSNFGLQKINEINPLKYPMCKLHETGHVIPTLTIYTDLKSCMAPWIILLSFYSLIFAEDLIEHNRLYSILVTLMMYHCLYYLLVTRNMLQLKHLMVYCNIILDMIWILSILQYCLFHTHILVELTLDMKQNYN